MVLNLQELVRSRLESSGPVRSPLESSGVIRNHPESSRVGVVVVRVGVVWSRLKSSGVVWNRPKSSRVFLSRSRSRPKPSGSVLFGVVWSRLGRSETSGVVRNYPESKSSSCRVVRDGVDGLRTTPDYYDSDSGRLQTTPTRTTTIPDDSDLERMVPILQESESN